MKGKRRSGLVNRDVVAGIADQRRVIVVDASDKYGNEIARVLRVIGDLLLTATDESDIHSIDGYWYNVVVPST